jgi:hypothetical protein
VVSFADLMASKPAEWTAAADAWRTLAQEAEEAADDIYNRGRPKVAANWMDDVGAFAGKQLDELANSYLTAAGTIRGVVFTLVGMAESVGSLQQSLQSAVGYARQHGLIVDADGSVRTPSGWAGPLEVLGEASALIKEAVDSANWIDLQARMQLDKFAEAVTNTDRDHAVNDLQPAGAQNLMFYALPIGQNPETVERWWNGLTPEERTGFERAVPVELHDLNGIPEDVKRRLEGDGGYNRVEMVRWAQQNAYNRDIDIFDNNCTNFVSHALSNAGLDHRTDPTGGSDSWSRGESTGLGWLDARNYSHSEAWTRSDTQRDFFLRHGGQEIPLDQASPGDIIYWEQAAPDGPIEEGRVHHAAVVTSVMPDGNVHYTQHTDSRVNASLEGRLPTNEVVEGDQRVVIVRPRQTW